MSVPQTEVSVAGGLDDRLRPSDGAVASLPGVIAEERYPSGAVLRTRSVTTVRS